jgi:hypothetical protein
VDAATATILGVAITGATSVGVAWAAYLGSRNQEQRRVRRERLEKAYIPLASFMWTCGEEDVRALLAERAKEPETFKSTEHKGQGSATTEMVSLAHLYGSKPLFALFGAWMDELRDTLNETDDSKIEEHLKELERLRVSIHTTVQKELAKSA